MERTHGELTFRWAGDNRVAVQLDGRLVDVMVVGWNAPLNRATVDERIAAWLREHSEPDPEPRPQLRVVGSENPLFTELGRAWAEVDAGRPAPPAPRRQVRMGVWMPPRHRRSPLGTLLRRGTFAVGCAIGLGVVAVLAGLVTLATILWGGRGLLAALAVVVVALALVGITREG